MAVYEFSEKTTQPPLTKIDNFNHERLPIEHLRNRIDPEKSHSGRSSESTGGGGVPGGALSPADSKIGSPGSTKSGEVVVTPIQGLINHSAGRSSEK